MKNIHFLFGFILFFFLILIFAPFANAASYCSYSGGFCGASGGDTFVCCDSTVCTGSVCTPPTPTSIPPTPTPQPDVFNFRVLVETHNFGVKDGDENYYTVPGDGLAAQIQLYSGNGAFAISGPIPYRTVSCTTNCNNFSTSVSNPPTNTSAKITIPSGFDMSPGQTNARYVTNGSTNTWYIRRPPTCTSITNDSGAITYSGNTTDVVPGQTYRLLGHIINDDGDHSNSDWSATNGTLSEAWDYADWTAPVTSGTYTVSYTLNGDAQASCTSQFRVPSAQLTVNAWVDRGTYNNVYSALTDEMPRYNSDISITSPTGTVTTFLVCNAVFCNAPPQVSQSFSVDSSTQYNSQMTYNKGLYTLKTPATNPYYYAFTADTTINYIFHDTQPPPCTTFGDIDGDGRVSGLDVPEMQRISLGLTTDTNGNTFTPLQIANSDVDGNGSTTISDVARVNAFVNETISTFPVCTPPTPTPTGILTPTPTSVPCVVTTSPVSCSLTVGSSCTISASVTSGLGGSSVTDMDFGSYDTGVVTVSPALDVSSPFQTQATGVGAGSAAVWATATLNDGRTCSTTGGTDTDTPVTAPTATPTTTPIPTPTSTPIPTPTSTPPPTYTISGQVYEDVNDSFTKNGAESGYTGSIVQIVRSITSTGTIVAPDEYSNISTGNYSFPGVVAGTYNINAIPPTGFVQTQHSTGLVVGPSAVNQDIGIYQADTCHDSADNNSNGVSDCNDTYCHTDYNPLNAASCCAPGDTSCDETNPPTVGECIDSLDNDTDSLIDGGDPDCHTDNNPANPTSYDPTRKENPSPACTNGVSVNGPTYSSPNAISLAPGGTTQIKVDTCTYVDPPSSPPPGAPFYPPSYPWTPYTPGGLPTGDDPECAGAGAAISAVTNSGTSSTATYTAPSCPTKPLTCHPQVIVKGNQGSNTTYKDATISITSTYDLTVRVRSMNAVVGCSSSAGVAYAGAASINVTGMSQNITQPTSAGSTSFACLPPTTPGNTYLATISNISGYTVVGISDGTASGNNGITTPLSGDTTVTFCIAPNIPWFQTDTGDVRYVNITNPVPSGLYGSIGGNYPGIFYSSKSDANLGTGSVNTKNWKVNSEYSYGSDTENRNGSMSYDFYKSKTKQDGVVVTQIDDGILNAAQLTTSGVYEVKNSGSLTINAPIDISGRRIVILASGNVTIDAPITVEPSNGIFILAVKGDIFVDRVVGVSESTVYDLNTPATHSLDGYYTAQGTITLDGDLCATGVSDKRLNVGGALIANSLKPFSSTGTGNIRNNRSLCINNLVYPSLFVASRPDFLPQLTDFYKTSYTKWQEINP